MSPRVTGNEEALDFYIADADRFAVFQQSFAVEDRHLRQFVQMIDHFAAHLTRQIAVFGFADVQALPF